MRRWLAPLLAMVLLSATPPRGACAQTVGDLDERLAALGPSEPRAYLELAEEVQYEMPSGAGQRLARELFVLAIGLDLASDEPEGIAASACLALADMSAEPAERRWLVAVARSLAVDEEGPGWTLDDTSIEDDSAAARLADALAEYRGGRRQRVRRFVERDAVHRMLERRGMDESTAQDLESSLRRDMRSPPASMAGGDRTATDPVERGRLRLHPDNNGNPGPALDARAMSLHLRAEAFLLDADPSSWAAGALVDGGAPLRSIEPEGVAQRYRVDPSAIYWIPGASAEDALGARWSAEPPAGAESAR